MNKNTKLILGFVGAGIGVYIIYKLINKAANPDYTFDYQNKK